MQGQSAESLYQHGLHREDGKSTCISTSVRESRQQCYYGTDSYAPYRNFAETENIQIEQILSKAHAKGVFNLGHINSLHSRLSAFRPKATERDPATKYIDLQLMLFWWLEENQGLSIAEKVDVLYSYLSEQYYDGLTYDKLIHRPLARDTEGPIPKQV